METVSFMIACRRFFGLQPDQKLQAFADEIRALTPKDREELRPLLAGELGVTVQM